VAAATIETSDSDGYVLDYESYFVVFRRRPRAEWQNGRLSAQFHDRQELEVPVPAFVEPVMAGEGVRDATGGTARVAGGSGEPEARDRGDHEMECIGGVDGALVSHARLGTAPTTPVRRAARVGA
jgi:hypothetical protein